MSQRNGLHPLGYIRQWDFDQRISSDPHHISELSFYYHVYRPCAQPRRQHSIERRGSASPLQITHHHGASFNACYLLDLSPQNEADAAQANRVGAFLHNSLDYYIPALWFRPLRDYHDAEPLALPASLSHLIGYDVQVVRYIGDKYYIITDW